MGATSLSKLKFEDYDSFVEKFKPKKTTDDCYTPPEIYDVVADYVTERFGIDRADMVRPFYPGGDFENFDYPERCCVVDNPPFSILQKIKRFYRDNGIKFFIFAPSLTAFSGALTTEFTHIICDASHAVPSAALRLHPHKQARSAGRQGHLRRRAAAERTSRSRVSRSPQMGAVGARANDGSRAVQIS